MLLTVDRPGVTRAFDRNLEAEGRIRDHVDPRRRRPLSFAENRYVLTAVRGKAAKPVEKFEVAPRHRDIRLAYRGRSPRWRPGRRREHLQPFDLLSQGPAAAQQHRSRRGLQNA